MSADMGVCTCCKKNQVPLGVTVCATCTGNAIRQSSGGISPFFADETFVDSVGGMHEGGIGWNPNGVWCGECCKDTCSGCVNEHKTEEIHL